MGQRGSKSDEAATTVRPITTRRETTTAATTTPVLTTTVTTQPSTTISTTVPSTHPFANYPFGSKSSTKATTSPLHVGHGISTSSLHTAPSTTTSSLHVSPSVTSIYNSHDIVRNSSYVLPLAIALSSSLLILALVVVALVCRKKERSVKHLEKGCGSPCRASAQVFPNVTFGSSDSIDCSSNHIYVDHLDNESKFSDGGYAYVPKITSGAAGGPSTGCTPSALTEKTVDRGSPDGKIKSFHIQGISDDVFGDEDQYNLLFEEKSAALKVAVANSYENAPFHGLYANYDSIKDTPLATSCDLRNQLTNQQTESTSLKGDSTSLSNRDSGHDTGSLSSSTGMCRDHPSLSEASHSSGVDQDVDVVYENTSRSRSGTSKSAMGGEPKYYVLERPSDEGVCSTCEDSGMIDNVLYQSITE
ncbi:uncharacterized protein [Diadema antillarum]|uniref:uncharacterized protein n=1 Tax=Diadema antillarum TaxID=105358 RepID=UPI003A858F97